MAIIEKTTPTDHDIHHMVENRWSPRIFSDQKISEKEIKQLLEAGRWAPSSNNLQPWRIIWGIKGTDVYDRIFSCLDEFNQSWANHSQALMMGAFKKTMKDGKENFHALHDLGLFSANLTFQAQHMGIAVHQMAGIKFRDAAKEFKFPDNYHVATGIALGYYGGDPSKLPEDLEKGERKEMRSRNPQSSFAFNGDFTGE